MFDVTERVRTGLHLLDSDNVNSLTSPPLNFDCLLATSAACFSSEVDEKLIELVRKCEKLYDMTNKKYRVSEKDCTLFLFFFLGALCVESGVNCTDCY
jgi:hypothetical protein